jgi:hypothetical protein
MDKAESHSTPLSRRLLLRSASAAALIAPATLAVSLPADAAAPDEPLIALCKAERAAYRKYDETQKARDDAEGAFMEAHGCWPCEEGADPNFDHSLYDAQEEAESAWEDSRGAIIDTPAVTVAGIAVKLRHISRELEDGSIIVDHDLAILASVLADAERLTRGGAA